MAQLRFRCASLPRLLRERAESTISPGDLDRLYAHLNRCHHCAAVESRFQAAEWYLHSELTESRTDGRTGPLHANHDAIPPSNGSPPSAALHEPTAPRDATPTPPFIRAARRLRAHPKRSGVGLALVVLAVAAVVAISTGGKSPRPAPVAVHPGAVATTPQPPVATTPTAPPPAVVHTPTNLQATGRAFTVAGASFLVTASPREAWTLFSTQVDPGVGQRWELVSVTVKNLTRTRFDPRRLHYRIVDASGTAYYPVKNRGTTPPTTPPLQAMPKGASTETRLAFRVARTGKRLQLRFNPTTKPYRVEVRLGP